MPVILVEEFRDILHAAPTPRVKMNVIAVRTARGSSPAAIDVIKPIAPSAVFTAQYSEQGLHPAHETGNVR